MNLYQSFWNTEKFDNRSCWDEPPKPQNDNIEPSNTKTSFHAMKIQLLGVAGVLLIILAVVIPLTLVLSNIKTTNTTITTGTSKMLAIQPYTCDNMTFLNSTIFLDNNLASFFSMDYSTCCSSCLITTDCVAFTLDIPGNICYQKSSILSGSRYDMNYVSAKY